MYNFKKLVLGVAPTRRDTFPPPAGAQKVKAEATPKLMEIFGKIHDLEIVDIESVNSEGMVYSYEDVPKVVELFKSKGVDAVFFPHYNFGQEEPVAMIAKAMGVPALLWGPRDECPPDPDVSRNRQTDIQCGLFATTKAFVSYKVPFTYIENCWLDSPVLAKGIEDFVRVASIVKAFRDTRILQLSVRPRQFLSVKVSESELLAKFGIEVIPVESAEIIRTIKTILADKKSEVDAVVSEWKRDYHIVNNTDEELANMAGLALGVLELASKYKCNVAAGECWQLIRSTFGVSCCFVWGWLTGKGLPVACETDIHGSVTSSMLMGAVRGEVDTFLADITVRHPSNENAELFWHCGPFPKSLARAGVRTDIKDGKGFYELEHCDYTICRFDQADGNYSVFLGEGKGVDGPRTDGNYVWVEVADWVAWEKKLMYGPYIHHSVCTQGKFKDVLIEACKYIPGLCADPAV